MQGNRFSEWQPPTGWHIIDTLDCHTGGEPLRIVTAGFPELAGNTVLERRQDCRQRYDHLRQRLMFEPRGHADMYGCIIVPPEKADSQFGAIFLHNEGYSTMCGHAVIALAKLAVESGLVAAQEPLTTMRIDVPCGQVTAYADVRDGKVLRTRFDNVPSFVAQLDAEVHVEGMGRIRFTLAYGGAYYAYVDATEIGLSLAADNHQRIIEAGRKIKAAVQQHWPVQHPFEPDLSFLYGTIFSAPADTPGVHSRNVCIFADGELDRSPTGSGVSGQAAILHTRGLLKPGEDIVIESILGSQFRIQIRDTLHYGPYAAVIPTVEGQAFVTGRQRFMLDPEDPFPQGFLFR